MIRWQRSIQAKMGKMQEAIQWAKEVAEYLNAHHPETSVQVFTGRFGTWNTIYWVSELKDLAALERWQAQFTSDEGYQKLGRKSREAGLWVDGSGFDSLMESA